MKSLNYLTPEEIVKSRDSILMEMIEQNSSPIIKSGLAENIALKYARPEDKILDCAPGLGSFLAGLQVRKFNQLYAVDIDNYLANSLAGIDLRLADLSFSALPWLDNFFNMVTAWQLVEHLENPHNFIREIHRVLKPSGLFIISMPNVQHIFNRIFFLRKGDMFRWHRKNNHIAVFPKGIFEKAFLKYFEVVEKKFSEGEFPYRFLSKFKFPNNVWFGRDVIYVFRKKQ